MSDIVVMPIEKIKKKCLCCSDRTECLWYNYDIEENLFDEI